MTAKTPYTHADLVLVRSDTGDGGWSLHLRGDADDSDPVAYGPADWVAETEDEYGHWSRPDDRDYDDALAKLNALRLPPDGWSLTDL